MKLKILVFFIFSGLILVNEFVQSAKAFDIVINEVAWMGTEVSYNNEWIELYNNTDSEINIDGWLLKAVDGTPEINLTGIIPAKGFYLLERTDDTTVPNILADQIYTGALSNNGEHLQLFDEQNNLVDEVNCSQGWFAGDNSTKQTVERKNPVLEANSSNWQMSKNPGGTPKLKNSTKLPEVEPLITEDKEGVEEKAESVNYPLGIIFNEILPSPEGPDAENEWIEIFNQNDFEIDLSGWEISDTVGSTKTYTFPEGTKIGPKAFLVLLRPETKITLNNDSDNLKLSQPNGKVVDSVAYEKAPRGQSYSLVDSEWGWNTILTPGKTNITAVSNAAKVEKKKGSQEKIPDVLAETELPKETKQELAAVREQVPEENLEFLEIFSIALSLALFSGTTILFLKNKLKKDLS